MNNASVIRIENADIRFKNFSGAEGQFNPAGRRNFCVLFDEQQAEELMAAGWNIRMLRPQDEGDAPQPYMQVAVSFSNVPPKVVLITSRGKTQLDEETINMLDYAKFANVDLAISPYHWQVSGRSGVKAYLKTMYVTLEEDEFESKYIDVPDSAVNSLTVHQA